MEKLFIMKTKIKTTWQKVKLGNIADLNMGQSPKSEFYNDIGEGLPFFQGVKDFGERKPTETMYCSKPAKIVQTGDVLISVRAPVGDINIAEKESCIGRGVAGIRAKDKNNEFIYYLLLNFKDYIRSYSGGTTYESINKDALRDLQFLVPENSVIRKQIADVLSAYDDLIENNTKRIKILEQIAQAIYKEWFVYFRFPGHEKAKSRSERSSATGIKMIDSKTEFGKIPEGWEIENLGSVAENYDSKRRPVSKMKRQTMQGEIPYYGAAKIIDYVNDHIFDGKYLLLAEDGSVITKSGNPVLQFVNEKFWANNHTHILQGVRVSTEYLYLYLSGLSIQGYITGVAQPKINQDNLNRILVLVPKGEVAKKFNELAEPIFEEVWKLKETIIKLQKVRDLLLPKLVEGEIEVS